MKTESLRKFVVMQFSLMLLILTTLPEINILDILGVPTFDFKEAICKIVGVVCGGLSLKYFLGDFKAQGKSVPMPFLICAAVGMVVALVSIIPTMPMWLEYVALVAFIVALCMSTKSLEIKYVNDGIKAAYLILIALLLRLFADIEGSFLLSIASLVGLFIYMKSLSRIGAVVDEAGAKAFGKIKTAVILSLIAVFVGFIPLFGFIIAGVLCIVAFFMEFSAYGALKSCEALGAEGMAGAGKLRTSMIILIIGAIIGIIPMIGGTIAGFLTIIALWFVFKGWSSIMMSLNDMAMAGGNCCCAAAEPVAVVEAEAPAAEEVAEPVAEETEE